MLMAFRLAFFISLHSTAQLLPSPSSLFPGDHLFLSPHGRYHLVQASLVGRIGIFEKGCRHHPLRKKKGE